VALEHRERSLRLVKLGPRPKPGGSARSAAALALWLQHLADRVLAPLEAVVELLPGEVGVPLEVMGFVVQCPLEGGQDRPFHVFGVIACRGIGRAAYVGTSAIHGSEGRCLLTSWD
jgi:hypothetical protein